jgi:hypothetical protein
MEIRQAAINTFVEHHFHDPLDDWYRLDQPYCDCEVVNYQQPLTGRSFTRFVRLN